MKKPQKQKQTVVDYQEVQSLISRLNEYTESSPTEFKDLPLSSKTLTGLKRGGFATLTQIQKHAIVPALQGHDILAAAKTGSGKTLAFIVPLLDKLFLTQHGRQLGIGAIILSPTRELALQIFEVVKIIGLKHNLNAALFVGSGGSKIKATKSEYEKKRIKDANIVVATPGRLLEHLEKSDGVNTSEANLLVLDEADRLLDMGFKPQILSILEYLPSPTKFSKEKTFDIYRRQTILFSATQTKSVKALAKLSLKRPKIISVHDQEDESTPKRLSQVYSIVNLKDKLTVLWSFIRSHLRSKIIVFVSSCKQVQFIDTCFRKLQPGMRLLSIHGKMKQFKRMNVYYDFVNHDQSDPEANKLMHDHENKKLNYKEWKAKPQLNNRQRRPASGICLFATDVVARGLDFPAVDWVIQVDCPEDVNAYIHRVGRTARFTNEGKSLLMLTPDESTELLPLLEEAKVPILQKEINPARLDQTSMGNSKNGKYLADKLASLVASDQTIKVLAQKAFRSYVRSIHLQPNKKVFNWKSLPLKALAMAFGLPSTPRLKIHGEGGDIDRSKLRETKNTSTLTLNQVDDSFLTPEELEERRKEKAKKKAEATAIMSENVFGEVDDIEEALDEDEDDILVAKSTKRKLPTLRADHESMQKDISIARAKKKLKISNQGVRKGKKGVRTVFDDDDNAVSELNTLKNGLESSPADQDQYLSQVKSRMKSTEADDVSDEKNRLKKKRADTKSKLKKKEERDREEAEAEAEQSDSSSHLSEDPITDTKDLEAQALAMIGL